MSQTLKSGIGLHIISQLAVQTYLTAPQVPVVWLEFKQFVDVTDGTGIVFQIIFNVNQDSLGSIMLVICLSGTDQVITSLIHIADDVIIPAIVITQVRVIRIILQSGINLSLGGVPGV